MLLLQGLLEISAWQTRCFDPDFQTQRIPLLRSSQGLVDWPVYLVAVWNEGLLIHATQALV